MIGSNNLIFYLNPYSYVDPLGSLITVSYTAGPDGYLETRNVQEGFISINQQQASTSGSSFGSTTSFVAPARPVVAQQQVSTVSSSSGDSDLVSKIISQLTPFIQQSVSSTLSSSSSSSSSQSAPVATPIAAPAAQRPIAPVAPVTQRPIAPVAPAAPAASSVEGVFGLSGQNNVRVETPNFNFNYDLQK